MAMRLAQDNIIATVLAGRVPSEMNRNARDHAARSPSACRSVRVGNEDYMAGAAIFLASGRRLCRGFHVGGRRRSGVCAARWPQPLSHTDRQEANGSPRRSGRAGTGIGRATCVLCRGRTAAGRMLRKRGAGLFAEIAAGGHHVA